MIARIWHGAVQTPRKDADYDYMMKTGVPWYKSLEGNRGVLVLQKTSPETTDFLLLSFWDSMDAVRKFAGENPELAVYDFDEDKDFLLEME
ncbi:MAG: antibiotic biosynthesis monooxygenase, partial [Acidobacteria bacterium]|nr:antibiotic biosynthesis monooxygenase [Acidobacteriota bacterium]